MTPFGYLFDCLDLELIRVPLAAHADLLGCHKLWLEDVYKRLAIMLRDITAIVCRLQAKFLSLVP